MFTGDVVQTQAPQAVFLPPLLLATVQLDVVAHPLNQQLLNFHADDNLEVQDPVEADVPETMSESIGTRHAMYLPAHLVPLFMGTRRTPREALMIVHTALIELGDLETFKPLMDWLRVAVTRDGALAIERASGPTSPIMENRLHERLIQLENKICRDGNRSKFLSHERRQDHQTPTYRNSWRSSYFNSSPAVHRPLPTTPIKIQAKSGRGRSTSSCD
jgi:hypothetical protein